MTDETLEKLSKALTDQGLLIEAGFVAMRHLAMRKDASELQVQEMRRAFFAGAQHLFASIMTVLDEGEDDEPTDADMRRMDQIAAELERFRAQLERDLPTAGRA